MRLQEILTGSQIMHLDLIFAASATLRPSVYAQKVAIKKPFFWQEKGHDKSGKRP